MVPHAARPAATHAWAPPPEPPKENHGHHTPQLRPPGQHRRPPLALAEAQRYIPSLITKIEPLLAKHNLSQDDIVLRMTGCPNGCGRSTAAEIGFVGTAYGLYNLHIGGDRLGLRLNKKYKDNLNEEQILQTLDELFHVYATEKRGNETFDRIRKTRKYQGIPQTETVNYRYAKH